MMQPWGQKTDTVSSFRFKEIQREITVETAPGRERLPSCCVDQAHEAIMGILQAAPGVNVVLAALLQTIVTGSVWRDPQGTPPPIWTSSYCLGAVGQTGIHSEWSRHDDTPIAPKSGQYSCVTSAGYVKAVKLACEGCLHSITWELGVATGSCRKALQGTANMRPAPAKGRCGHPLLFLILAKAKWMGLCWEGNEEVRDSKAVKPRNLNGAGMNKSKLADNQNHWFFLRWGRASHSPPSQCRYKRQPGSWKIIHFQLLNPKPKFSFGWTKL